MFKYTIFCYRIYSDVIRKFKYLTTHWCVTRRESVFLFANTHIRERLIKHALKSDHVGLVSIWTLYLCYIRTVVFYYNMNALISSIFFEIYDIDFDGP